MDLQEQPIFESIKFPIENNIGLEGFNDYEIVNSESLSINAIVEWCIEQMQNIMWLKSSWIRIDLSCLEKYLNEKGLL